MTATVGEIANGLQARLATITGVRAHSSKPPQFNPTDAYPVLNLVQYHKTFGGGDIVSSWLIVVVVGRWDDDRAYSVLDEFLSYSGTKSIRAAIEGDTTLAGKAMALQVPTGASITPVQQADAEFMQAIFDCVVHHA